MAAANACTEQKFCFKRGDVMAVAKEEEILDYLTYIMRREDEEIRLADSFKAAELLGKYYGMFSDKHHKEVGDVIIVDNIPVAENAV